MRPYVNPKFLRWVLTIPTYDCQSWSLGSEPVYGRTPLEGFKEIEKQFEPGTLRFRGERTVFIIQKETGGLISSELMEFWPKGFDPIIKEWFNQKYNNR